MIVERRGRSFDVVDDPQTGSWNFWPDHFAKEWEAGTLALLDGLTPERDYLDIGAWVGPTVLWGAPLARRCIAVEPDPVAVSVLRENVRRNCSNVSIVEAAVAAADGTAELETGGAWGDSMSSLQRRGGETVTVRTVSLDSVLAGIDPALVKVDIEGGEAGLLPPNVDLLHDLGCPIILGIHWPWMSGEEQSAVAAVIETFTVEVLDPHPLFPTVVLR